MPLTRSDAASRRIEAAPLLVVGANDVFEFTRAKRCTMPSQGVKERIHVDPARLVELKANTAWVMAQHVGQTPTDASAVRTPSA